MNTKKLKIAIFDLTDCEGCELQFIALRQELLKEGVGFEVVNWRLGTSHQDHGPFDVTFIEGSPISKADIEIVKQARAHSKTIVTLGSCAAMGGVQASLAEGERATNLAAVYGAKYKSSSLPPRPVNYYIEVDIHLPGCPINTTELKRLLTDLAHRRKFAPKYFPVCLECKANHTPCLFLEEGFCLGPVTQGGCDAICTQKGLRCYGCRGPLKGANLAAYQNVSQKSKQELERDLRLFFAETCEYKEIKGKRK